MEISFTGFYLMVAAVSLVYIVYFFLRPPEFWREFALTIAIPVQAELRPIAKELLPGRGAGYVYLMRDTSVTQYIKIGKTINARNRIGHFDTMLPFETEVLALLETSDCAKLEHELHRRYASKRIRGEWFNLTAQDIEEIRAIAKSH